MRTKALQPESKQPMERAQALQQPAVSADFKTITQNILIPWDKKLNNAKTAGKKMVAKDQAHCETIFYAQFIGSHQTPDEIVDAIVDRVNATGRAFHGTRAGKNVQIKNIHADPQCKNITADAKP